MSSGRVDELSWARLRPRPDVPQAVLDSIPPQDIKSFVHLVATSSFTVQGANIMRQRLRSLQDWRVETRSLEPKLAAVEKQNGKRVREEPDYRPPPDFEPEDLDDEQPPRRKQRRSTSRPSISIPSPPSPLLSERESATVQIGENHQADVPEKTLTEQQRKQNPPVVSSKLVFSVRACGGDTVINRFLSHANTRSRQQRGFDLAPFQMEVALEQLTACKGNEIQAVQRIKQRLPEGPYFPGLKRVFGYEELCSFVRALEERGKNFEHISRYLLPHRSTSELIWMYYARHKQLRMQSCSRLREENFKDNGLSALKMLPMPVTRAVSAVHSRAISVGDGFPLDSRVQRMFLSLRQVVAERELKRRNDEALRRHSRLRSRNE
ncbi:Homeobox-like protein [Gracilaria domingensis]|nr:Homeobox-like protein [Gracilaria domingensis]